jgi:hypothetical protein
MTFQAFFPYLSLENLQAEIIMLIKVRKNKELMKELSARYIFGKLSSDR